MVADSLGARIAFEVQGDGEEALVFLPGLGLPGQAFSLVTPAFIDRFRVITVDPRGAGQSDKPDEPYTSAVVAADLAAVLDAAEVEKAHIIGLSMGGMIGQTFALTAPQRVLSLVQLSTYAAVDGWSGRCLRLRRKLIEELGLMAQLDLSLLLVSCPKTVHRAEKLVEGFESMLRADPPPVEGYLRQLDYCLAHDTTARLSEIAAPTLVVTGSDDILTPSHQGAALADGIPGALFRVVDDASHALVWEFPDLFVELLDSFFIWQQTRCRTRRPTTLRITPRPFTTPEALALDTTV